MDTISETVARQRDFFNGGATLDVKWRKRQLSALASAIRRNEAEVLSALRDDLNKSEFEGYVTEISIVLEEIAYALRHLQKWARPQKVRTPLVQFPAKSVRYFEPYGVALIMAPWNYPFQLTLAPLVGAIAGGNCAVLKPSNYSPATSAVIAKIVGEAFPPEYVVVVLGGREANKSLLGEKFDYIFFTGGITVGKLVMQSAAQNLTPVSLELGGKSPCIVEKSADIDLSAKRIVWGKFINAGQTCVAPDYVLVESSVKAEFLAAAQKWVARFWGENPLCNAELPKIITEKHFARISAFIDGSCAANGAVVCGGKTDAASRKIAPTVLDGPAPDSPVMGEEIFGPVLPVLEVQSLGEALDFVRARPKPLALYLFTRSKAAERLVVSGLSYGGGCINDVLVHLATNYMPFGGVGASGMGAYHGRQSFETFTHAKSVMKKANWLDIPLRYAPYAGKLKIAKKFL